MRCPKCDYQNKPGLEFCAHCHEVLMHSAPKGYLRRVHQDKRKRSELQSYQAHRESQVRDAVIEAGKRMFWRNSYWVPIGLGAALILFSFSHYHSPLTHLQLHGTSLRLLPPQDKPTHYLIGLESNADLWTERDRSPDAPL